MRLLASVSMPDLFTDQQVGVESFRKATERGESMASTRATRASGHPCECIITIYPSPTASFKPPAPAPSLGIALYANL